MKVRFSYAIAFLLITTSSAQSQATVGKPFHFSSRETAYGVQGELEGTYLIQDDSIAVNVKKMTIYVSEHCPYQGPRAINRLRFGLATEDGPNDRWKIESAAPPTLLTLVMSPKEEYTVYDSYFLIPKER